MSRKNAAGSSITDLVGVMPRVKLDGGSVSEWIFPELGAESFLAGEMVCLSGVPGTGRAGLTKPGTDASGYGILGFAADAASGATSSVHGVYVATPDTVFCGNVGHATSALAQTAALQWGMTYGLTSLSGRSYVDVGKGGLAGTSTAMCRVVGFFEQDVVPTFYGRVLFQVLAPKCQMVNNLWLTSSPVDGVI